ncbi:hypothetical protein [Micromonospora cathayae]|uniref:Uncharacterized protein n=1 Tax=Micromonospora cathayae TaxID=3028804 RepID=A0ABY7ZTB1_9ACTN|nr:hypothetical protein [Micromonospora sp. HUAS 3]WDZ85268.1 hypothetical protein PVK37_02040 [Micromonospora sp. HUAS 3]
MRTDICEPDLLWTRWGLLSAALTALGHDDVYWCAADGAHHDDHGGNWARLVRVDGGRAVLFGYDHEYSDTVDATPPVDLLAGAPAWLPWPELLRYVADDQLGYVHWYDREWSRVPYPAGLADGLTATVGALLDADRLEGQLSDVVTEWGGHEPAGPAERDDLARAAARLRVAAEARTLDPADLTGLLGRLRHRTVDLAAALTVAADAGLTPGSALPSVPAGTEVPRRRIRQLSGTQHEELVRAAMRAATERQRPPTAPTAELTALVDWVRGHTPDGDGRCLLLVEVTDTGLRPVPGPRPPAGVFGDGWTAFRELAGLVRQLRAAEAHPEHGRWFHLRLETTPDGYAVERYYDTVPDWLPADDRHPIWLDALRQEMDRRTPEFRPTWAARLAPEVAWGYADPA